jgi:hypothetical protein
LTNKGEVAAIAIKLNLTDAISGKLILPAYFSDGYFNLLPGEKKEIAVNFDGSLYTNVKLKTEGYNCQMDE